MIAARDELTHAVSTFSEAEAEKALELLAPLLQPHCPACFEDDIDELVWQADGVHVRCNSCGRTWAPGGEETRLEEARGQ